MENVLPVGEEPNPVKCLSLINSSEIRDHFPFPEIRSPQETALRAVEQAIREGKKYIIMELPTGAGKSGIGIAAGSLAKTLFANGDFQQGAYYLSPQKSLTAQLVRDFGTMGLSELKGKSNYSCGYHYSEDEGGGEMDCETADFMFEEHAARGGCKGYRRAKGEFCASSLGVTNFAYYLAETSVVGQLKKRTMLILDECHGTEQHILSLANTEITRWRCEEVNVDFNSVPFVKADEEGMGTAVDWLKTTFRPMAIAAIRHLGDKAESLRESMQKEAAKLMRKKNGLERFVGQLDMFLRAEDRKGHSISLATTGAA